MSLPKQVRIVEVGPRDGLQNEATPVPATVKIELIHRLQDAGVSIIEATAFVSPKWVPQMADNADVMAGIRRKPGVTYPVLVPNMKGLDAAIAAGADEVVVFGAATESFSRRNTNCSIDEGLTRFEAVAKAAIAQGIRVRGDISVCLGCPYEGEVDPAAVVHVARALDAMGCYEITVCDTIGTGAWTTPLFGLYQMLVGDRICVLTNQLNYGVITLRAVPNPQWVNLNIDYVAWPRS